MAPGVSKDQKPAVDMPLLKAAGIYKAKYCVQTQMNLPIAILGVHMCNRGQSQVLYPNGADVRHLGLAIWDIGFDVSLANQNGVAVQEIPGADRVRMLLDYEEELRQQQKDAVLRQKKRADRQLANANIHGIDAAPGLDPEKKEERGAADANSHGIEEDPGLDPKKREERDAADDRLIKLSDADIHELGNTWMLEKYPYISSYNRGHTKDTEFLSNCFPEATLSIIGAGTLAHSHLVLVLRSAEYGNKWKGDKESANADYVRPPWDMNGNLDAQKMSEEDGDLKQLLEHGLTMDLLSWKIFVEEPDACTLISEACNMPNKMAINQTLIAMLSELTNTVARLRGSAEMTTTYIKVQLQKRCGELVNSDSFLKWFCLVVELGEEQNNYLKEFFLFTTQCIQSKFRQLPSDAVEAIHPVSFNYPRTKIAFLKRCLLGSPVNGICPKPENGLGDYTPEAFDALEVVLRLFRTTCLSHIADVLKTKKDQIVFLAHVDKDAANAFKNEGPKQKVYMMKLLKATYPYHKQLSQSQIPLDDKIEGPWTVTFSQAAAELAKDERQEKRAHMRTQEDAARMCNPVVIVHNEETGALERSRSPAGKRHYKRKLHLAY